MTNRLEIQDRGVMHSCYFSGTPGVMLSLYIDNKTTIGEIIGQLGSEINMIWDHIEYTAQYHEFSGDLEKAIDSEIQAIKTENKGKLDKICFPDIEFCFDDMSEDDFDQEYPVLILTIEFMEDETC